MKKFWIVVNWTVSKGYDVESDTKEEAMTIVQKQVDAGELSYFDDDYSSTEVNIEYVEEEDTP